MVVSVSVSQCAQDCTIYLLFTCTDLPTAPLVPTDKENSDTHVSPHLIAGTYAHKLPVIQLLIDSNTCTIVKLYVEYLTF